ncbi:MAG: hypothetical protein ACREEN_11025 [Stellaceae bacterium]
MELSTPTPLAAPRVRPRLFYLAAGALGTLIILGVLLVLASHVGFCGWRDACFYETLAQQFAQHRGFVLPFVWNYQVGNISLPNPALEYWRPGMSFILALPAVFGWGVTLFSAAVLDTAVTLLLSLSAAWLAWRMTADRLATLLAYFLWPVPGATLDDAADARFGAVLRRGGGVGSWRWSRSNAKISASS